jgi:two-component system NtrC family sensor kinase
VSAKQLYRTLVIDDDPCVHNVFANMLSQEFVPSARPQPAGLALPAESVPEAQFPRFEVDCAFGGEQGLEYVRKALAHKRPYAMAFVDLRMQAGWDGIETIGHLWREFPDLQIILCTGHSDFTWHDIIKRFGHTDRLLMLKKPFSVMDLRQLAYALAEKWNLFNQAKSHLEHLQKLVAERTAKLQESNQSLEQKIAQYKKAQEELRRQRDYNDAIIQGTPAMVAGIAPSGLATFVNPSVCQHTGFHPDEIIGRDWWRLFYPGEEYRQVEQLFDLLKDGPARDHEMALTTKSGEKRTVNWNFFNKRGETGQADEWIAFGNDVTEQKLAEQGRRLMEIQLRHAQKLESVGQLAAGIAHEVNTPTQYIGDNIRFLQQSFARITPLLRQHERLLRAFQDHTATPELAGAMRRAVEECDLNFLLEETPRAIEQSLEGIHNVARIVHSMKDFSHPGSAEKILVDINQAVESTLVVSANEWKYVANLVKDLQPDLPRVPCLPGELNQVILNLVVNAAHAIAGVVGTEPREKGSITLATRRDGDWVEIQVADTGTGIPEAIRDKVFDPFFTTRSVGQGTGQGLAIARNVIVSRHHGTLTFQTQERIGTVFIIRLPIHPAAAAQPAEKAA